MLEDFFLMGLKENALIRIAIQKNEIILYRCFVPLNRVVGRENAAKEIHSMSSDFYSLFDDFLRFIQIPVFRNQFHGCYNQLSV